MQNRRHRHHRKDRPQRISQRAAADGRDRQTSHQPFGARGVDDGAARHLPEQADDAGDRQYETDLDLRPFLRGQIDRHEGTETGLHIGEKEDKPVEAALTFARWGWLASGHWRQRHNMIERWNNEISCGTTEIASRRLCCVTREMSWPSIVMLPRWTS